MTRLRTLRRTVGVVVAFVPLWLVSVGPATALDLGSSASPDSARCAETAADRHGWGTPEQSDEFNNIASLDNWYAYDGPGHENFGIRTPDAVDVSNGSLVITGDLAGNSGGVTPKWGGRKYGRWEICSRATVAGPAWTAAALLWPDAEDWPQGGEVDFMEISDGTRQTASYFLHYGPDNITEQHHTIVNSSQWHSWAVEWTPQHIKVLLDGNVWATSSNVDRLPPRSMHLTLQLDNFGGITFPGGQFYVDRVAEYGI